MTNGDKVGVTFDSARTRAKRSAGGSPAGLRVLHGAFRIVRWATVALCIHVALAGAPFLHARTIYVKAAASGSNDGTSWTNAYAELANALNASQAGDEVWVAAGTYKPDVNPTTGTH